MSSNTPRSWREAAALAARRVFEHFSRPEQQRTVDHLVRGDMAPEIPTLPVADASRSWLERRDLNDRLEKDIDVYALIEQRGLPLVEV